MNSEQRARELLAEILGDYAVALGVSDAAYRQFCERGAVGRMPSDTWARHCHRRMEQIEELARALEQPASAAGVEGSSGSVKQKLPPPKKYPKPDAEGNDTGPCCAHAYADGWNECRAAMLAAAPKPEDAS